MGKFEYEAGMMKEIGGSGISGLASRSDAARARELAKYGLKLDWFDALVESQHGLCSDCGHPERAKLANGKRKHLGLGFQDGQPNRLICQLCASKQRKQRAEDRKAPQDYASFEEFWQANRAKEDPAELARLQERHDEVSLLYGAICDYVRQTDRCPEGLQDTLNDTEHELREYGTIDLDMLFVPFYKVSSRAVYDAIQASAETYGAPQQNAVFARLGLITALPTHTTGTNYVRVFLRQNKRWEYPDWGKKPSSVEIIKCSTHGCHNTLEYDLRPHNPTEIHGPIPASVWYCDSCKVKRAVVKPVGVKRRPEDVLYTSGGTMKDLSDNLPVWLRDAGGSDVKS